MLFGFLFSFCVRVCVCFQVNIVEFCVVQRFARGHALFKTLYRQA